MSFSTFQGFLFRLAGRNPYLWAIIYYNEFFDTEAETIAFIRMIEFGFGEKESKTKQALKQVRPCPPTSYLRKYAFFRIFEIDFYFSFWKFRHGRYSSQCAAALDAIDTFFEYAVSVPGSDKARDSLKKLENIKIFSKTEQELMFQRVFSKKFE